MEIGAHAGKSVDLGIRKCLDMHRHKQLDQQGTRGIKTKYRRSIDLYSLDASKPALIILFVTVTYCYK